MENNRKNTQKKSGNHNFDLKSDAVDALVNADSEETPEYSQEELDKYRTRKGIHIPDTLKIVFIKAWFAGAVCYFFLWGLGSYISSMIDMLFVLGVVLGMVTDLLTNNVLRFIEKTPGGNDKWILFPKKGMMSFFLNMVYSCIIIVGVFMIYNGINYVFAVIIGDMETVFLGVEPILFGVFCMGLDMLFIGVKRLLSSVIRDAKESAKAQK